MSERHLDLPGIAARLTQAVTAVAEAAQQRAALPSDQQPDPKLLGRALDQLLGVLERAEPDSGAQSLDSDDITQLGDYALSLLGDLATWTRVLGLAQEQRDLQQLAVPIALWVVEHGGKLVSLEPVVDALALIANQTRDPRELARLSVTLERIVGAVAETVQQDLDKSNPGRPWRVLTLNRAIVATRSHDPQLMETAFQALLRHLPEDAPAFFREGMQQMEELNYPPHVRAVMQKYFSAWSAAKLH